MLASTVETYWQQYLQIEPDAIHFRLPDAVDQFADTPELADELGQLVLSGTKTATCSALWEWEAEQTALPTKGFTTLILNSAEVPICLIETTEVTVCAFEEVSAQFAYDEGEGDRSLESWRRDHWRYFSRVLPKIGKQPTPKMRLVCERFRVIHPAQHHDLTGHNELIEGR